MIQAGARLVEGVLAAVLMLREPQASLQAVMPEKHLAANLAGRLELAHAPEAEHFLIPGRARVNVTNRQPKVMNACDHALFTASMPRAVSRTGLALHQAPGPHGPSYRLIISTYASRTPARLRYGRTSPRGMTNKTGAVQTWAFCAPRAPGTATNRQRNCAPGPRLLP